MIIQQQCQGYPQHAHKLALMPDAELMKMATNLKIQPETIQMAKTLRS